MRTAGEAVCAYAEEVRRRTVEAALDWIERLFREASNRFQAEVASLISALESKMAEADGRTLDQLEQAFEPLAGGNRPYSRAWSAAAGLSAWRR
jgi:hypothetical protein